MIIDRLIITASELRWRHQWRFKDRTAVSLISFKDNFSELWAGSESLTRVMVCGSTNRRQMLSVWQRLQPAPAAAADFRHQRPVDSLLRAVVFLRVVTAAFTIL